MVLGTGGCDNKLSPPSQPPKAPANSPAPLQAATPESKLQLPEFYGLYAITGGKPIALQENGEPINLDSAVEFLWFNKSVAMANVHLVRLSLNSTSESPQSIESRFSGVPDDATRIEMRQKPVSNQPEMVRYVPPAPLPPGLYQVGVVGSNAKFWIDREGYVASQVKLARAALDAEEWERAVSYANVLLKIDPGDNGAQTMRDIGAQGVQAKKIAAEQRRARLTRESREEIGTPFSSDQEFMLCSFEFTGDRHWAKRVKRVEITNVNAKFTWREHWGGSNGWEGATENRLASETGQDKIFTLWFDNLAELKLNDTQATRYSRYGWENYPSGGDCNKCLVVIRLSNSGPSDGIYVYPEYELLFHKGGREAIYSKLRDALNEWRAKYGEILTHP
jgi:hypothetical protein